MAINNTLLCVRFQMDDTKIDRTVMLEKKKTYRRG